MGRLELKWQRVFGSQRGLLCLFRGLFEWEKKVERGGSRIGTWRQAVRVIVPV